MMDEKIYTIIAIFSVGDCTGADECWVAHFAKREDAIQAFKKKLLECGWYTDAEAVFDEVLSCGCCYDVESGGDMTRFFIRNEPVRKRFDEIGTYGRKDTFADARVTVTEFLDDLYDESGNCNQTFLEFERRLQEYFEYEPRDTENS